MRSRSASWPRCKGSVFDFIGERMLGARAGDILAMVAIISLAAGINAWTFAGPRIYYAMARDGVFFPAAAKVHPKFKTPHTSIIAQALWTSVLILTGSLDTLTNYVGFAITLFAGIAVAAIFVLRAREPNAPRPYKTLGYPVAPAIFVVASLAIVVNAIVQRPATDRPRPARHGRRYSAVRVADTAAPLKRRWGSGFLFQFRVRGGRVNASRRLFLRKKMRSCNRGATANPELGTGTGNL